MSATGGLGHVFGTKIEVFLLGSESSMSLTSVGDLRRVTDYV